MADEEATRLVSFIREQRRHWKRLRKGTVPEKHIIDGWIESCEFALEDLDSLIKQVLKGLT